MYHAVPCRERIRFILERERRGVEVVEIATSIQDTAWIGIWVADILREALQEVREKLAHVQPTLMKSLATKGAGKQEEDVSFYDTVVQVAKGRTRILLLLKTITETLNLPSIEVPYLMLGPIGFYG